MHRVADGVLPSISSSNKIAPVEVDPPPTETALLAERAGGGPMKGQDQLAPVDDVLGKICSLEEIEAAGSLASENVGVGDGEAGSDDVVSQGKRSPFLGTCSMKLSKACHGRDCVLCGRTWKS